ncbi:FecR domain-containing protein [Membranicola marinus]|uniref:FecR domain-containing protein n=1 Tax=Membranihabitans marinus TaxID=1227546 RepID=A0A953I164_9BACT|nr:FecR domain-containing protein [Membranihabitans marinus]MBY5959387.1 FecR domain-containing protein [Membranihabitans marinus]
MTQDNNKKEIGELYRKYLRGDLSKKEFEELFDIIQDDEDNQMLHRIIDDTLPAGVSTSPQANTVISDHIGSPTTPTGVFSISRRSFYRLSVAATVLILLFAVFYALDSSQEEWIVHTTDFQETKEVVLPDGSRIVLNANTELKWKKGFEKEDIRTVHFAGEGYFDVNHLDGKGFVVKTGSVDVNVLGTEFNLETRRHHTNVFLKEGKVVLKGRDIQPIEMVPGDLVHYDTEKKKISKVTDQSSESALSWKEGVFTFEDLTGIQILDKMEDIYGKEFIIETPGNLGDIIVVQGLPYTDWDFTREALELSLGVRFIDSTSNKIIVKTKQMSDNQNN